MRFTRVLSAAVVALGLAAGAAGGATSPPPTPTQPGDGAGPTQAGPSIRPASQLVHGQQATAGGSAGHYLYWSFPADAGQRPTVRATVKLPETHAAETWRIDVYDGLRRRQACQWGAETRTAQAGASSLELACVLRTVRAWSEPWANDPLPGTYYIRLTAVNLPASDLGVPVSTEVQVDSKDMGGAAAVDGALSEPLVPGIAVTSGNDEDADGEEDGERNAVLSAIEPEDGWSSGWWSDRWVWTGIGAVLAALAGIGGYALTRGSGRPSRTPPGA
ncbi:hypothetical protein [Streptomyces olivaceus]|uniref:hypothetical protein n=1 Tax=Streptomyces olivaceus TaxID=47716 RepID=UPI0040566700